MKRKTIGLLGLCVACFVVAGAQCSIEVNASEQTKVTDVTPSAGAASLVSMSWDAEECLALAEASEEAIGGYTNLGIANVESGNLNVRAIPGTDGKLVGKMPKGAACEILEVTEDGWAHIVSGEVDGYVSMDYLYIGADAKMKALELLRTVAVVNGDSVNVRDEASLDSAVLTQVPEGEEMEVLEVLDKWVKVSIDGEDGYVSADYVTVEEKLDTAITMSELRYGQGVSDLRIDIVDYALQFVGNPYVWGGTSLTKGADCSGFTMSVYKHFGISLSHSSRAQANEGDKITADQLQPGDLIFYANSSGTINHVAMYIGNGQVVHASSAKTGIKISNYTYRTPVRYVSILED